MFTLVTSVIAGTHVELDFVASQCTVLTIIMQSGHKLLFVL